VCRSASRNRRCDHRTDVLALFQRAKKALALPSEAPGSSSFKYLPKVLGKTASIDLQGVSAAVPKQFAKRSKAISRQRHNPACAEDIRQHGGVVSVHIVRDRCGGEPVFRVGPISGTGDVTFLSMPLIEDHASAASGLLGKFDSARDINLPPKAERVAGQGNPIAIQSKHVDVAITLEDRQQHCVARQFLLSPATPAMIARLAYGCAP
jgi:hypothetical protein